jgi:hypothetical protein
MSESNQPSTNTQSILSLSFGLLTLFSSCIGLVPIPFTGFICFPTAFLSSLLTVILGVIALVRIRRNDEQGAAFAWIGLIIGGITLLAFLCLASVIVALFILSPTHSWPTPPGFGGYQALVLKPLVDRVDSHRFF